MNKFVIISILTVAGLTKNSQCIKNSRSSDVDPELQHHTEVSASGQTGFGRSVDPTASSGALDVYSPASNQDGRISRPDRNFIITHEGILQYQPVSRSIHDLRDQEFKASSTYFKSEVIPVANDGGHRVLPGPITNGLAPAQSMARSNNDVHASYTSQDEVSVPLHVGFQVEDTPNSNILRMNPKGKVLSYDEGDLNIAANTNHAAYKQPPYVSGYRGNKVSKMHQMNDLNIAESNQMPFVFGQRVETPDSSPSAMKAKSLFNHHPSSSDMDLHYAASSYYKSIQPNQKHLNPYFSQINDLDIAASDPREAFEMYGKHSGHNSNPGGSSGASKDQSHDETKIYTDANAGGAKSYVDYQTSSDLESQKYGRFRGAGDVDDASSGHYEGQIPVHFGFQVEHPRLQYPPKSSYADNAHKQHHHHSDYSVPNVRPNKFKIPKVPKPATKYVPSIEDIDDDIESDFKHIKIKKYSTNNDELPIPSTYNARYSDEIPNPSKHSFKYMSTMDSNQFSTSNQHHNPYQELQRTSATTNENQQLLTPAQHMKIKKSAHPHFSANSQVQAQASQKYYQYIKPKNLLKKAGANLPVLYYV